jgi:hypothetical protein
VGRTATLKEFDETRRFFATSCDPDVGHTVRLFPLLRKIAAKQCDLYVFTPVGNRGENKK